VTADSDIPVFTHLHVHSSYSVGIGLATPEELCAHAKRSGYRSVALTDINGTYGYLEFHRAAKKYGIKPIYGAIVYHTSLASPGRERFTMTLLATSHTGLRNVTALTSLSATAYESGIALSHEQLQEHGDDVIALVGTVHSEIATLLLGGDDDGAANVLGGLKEVFRDRLYVEIQDHGDRAEKALAQELAALATKVSVAPVLTQEIRYTRPEMGDVYGLLSGIRHPYEESDFFKIDPDAPDRSMRSAKDMERLHSTYTQAFRNTFHVDRRILTDLLAHIDQPSALIDRLGGSKQSLSDLCTERFYKRYGNLSSADTDRYQSIIGNETNLITAAGLIPTFLLYHNIVTRLRRAGVVLGPATGINLQSLCAYLLEITSYNPYAYNPDFVPWFDSRIEAMAELEIQLTSENRASAVELLRDMVGAGSFAYVPAVERITPARAVRMVSGILDVGEDDVNEILRIIGQHPGLSIKALSEEDRRLAKVYKRSVRAREVITQAALLENLPSGFIKSRRTVALSAVPLTNYLAHSIETDSDDLFIHASRDVLPMEPILRIDFTPLSALNVVDRIDSALQREGKINYAWDRFPANDRAVWKEVRKGDPTGVFLFEGQTVRELRETFELRSIDDLINLLTLMRVRGDEGNLADRIKAFQRGEIFSGSDPPGIFRILRTTRGHILYDEQLRDILVVLTGADPAEAVSMLEDAKAIDPATLARGRGRFMRAMADHDVPMESATTWFERVLFYARQTIRRERVTADAILVYKMFYLKVYHSGFFYQAVLNIHRDNVGKVAKYLDHLNRHGMLLPLDINRSSYGFGSEDNKVRVGFCVVDGIDRMTVDHIIKLRGKNGFRTMAAFVQRTQPKGINGDQIDKLVMAGAFDTLDESRASLKKAVGKQPKKKSTASKRVKKDQMELPFDS